MSVKEQRAAMKEARKIAKTLVVTPKQLTFKKGSSKEGKLKALNRMMNEHGISDKEILKDRTIMAWLKSKTALLLQWYVGKNGDDAKHMWSMCYEKDLPHYTTSWIACMDEAQLTVFDADGDEVEIQVEKVKLVKV